MALDDRSSDLSQLRNESSRSVFEGSDIAMYYLNSLNHTEEPFRVPKKAIFLMPVAMYFSKGSFFRSVFDEQLLRFASNGILNHWIDQYQKGLYQKISDDSEPQVLTYEQLEAMFDILIAFHAIAFIVFIFEIIFYRLRNGMRVRARLALLLF